MKMFAAAVLAAVALSFSLQAQSPLAESIEVRVTNVDVVVVDKAGNPVPGLTKEDFQVLEAGKAQPITNFYEIRDTPAASGAAAAEATEVPPEVGRRRIVIFVDNRSINPMSRNQAFAALERALGKMMREGDEAMVVLWHHKQESAATFTADRAELSRRLAEAAKASAGGQSLAATRTRIIERAGQMLADAKANGNSRTGLTIPQAYQLATEQAMNAAEELMAQEQELLWALERTISTMAGIEGKKALIFLGAELPDHPGLELFQQIDGMFQFDLPNIRPAIMREGGRSLSADIRRLGRHANANNVTLYLVDTADRIRGGDPSDHALDLQASFSNQTNTPLAMANLASITGGIAVPGGRSFEKALDTVARDLSSYYSLGYRSPEAGEGDRRITVKVKNPAYRVRSRTSYIARSGDDEVKSRVVANIYHSGVKSDFPVTVTAARPEKMDGGSYKVRLTVTMPSDLTFIPQSGELAGEFAIFFASGKAGAEVSEVTKVVQPMRFPGNAGEAIKALKTFTYSAPLVVRAGEQIVSVGVLDTLAGTSGFARMTLVAE